MPLPTVRTLPFVIALIALVPSASSAEFRRIELKIFGMDCATCAHGVRVGIQKIDGVETVELSLERAAADITLRPDNQVTLEQFRQLVKLNGFSAREAIVTARGLVVEHDGKPTFEVSGIGTLLAIAADKSTPAASEQIKNLLAKKSTDLVEIVGTVQKRKDGSDEIVVTSVKESAK